ncbi:ribosome-associated protein [Anaerosolibacter carboniphilus]|uniref:Ribosomal silencing factor RsfS n=1 Tax=Anaerosolibacter carboniphilus TaxID=1417629 RepID=A0A841KRU3_9FIRM|nr:ribosome silencing factor [Anaerosolibacter carboniphilus]MBB6214868.1 ribosome-associated protein [Anaerosolibacter carboniphilus]
MLAESRQIAMKIAKTIDDKKGQDIAVLNIQSISSFADYFVIAHGTSTRHAKAIADEIIFKLAEDGIPLDHKEGHDNGTWILLDYLTVVVHIFIEEERHFYNLERVWKDAIFEDPDSL